MESTDKLREYGHDCCARVDDAIHDYCDEIEREIAERYMLLPVDADGVPIRVGDELTAAGLYGKVKVCALQYDGKWRVQDKTAGCWRDCAKLCHVKPRTIEDVLDEMADKIIRQGHLAGLTAPEIIAEYADELRSMGVGE